MEPGDFRASPQRWERLVLHGFPNVYRHGKLHALTTDVAADSYSRRSQPTVRTRHYPYRSTGEKIGVGPGKTSLTRSSPQSTRMSLMAGCSTRRKKASMDATPVSPGSV